MLFYTTQNGHPGILLWPVHPPVGRDLVNRPGLVQQESMLTALGRLTL